MIEPPCWASKSLTAAVKLLFLPSSAAQYQWKNNVLSICASVIFEVPPAVAPPTGLSNHVTVVLTKDIVVVVLRRPEAPVICVYKAQNLNANVAIGIDTTWCY